MRESADAAFFEDLDDKKIELMLVFQDGVDELQRTGTAVLEECREKADEMVEDVDERVSETAERVFEDVRDRLKGLEHVRCIRCERVGGCESQVSSNIVFVRGRRRPSGRRGGKGGYRGIGVR